MHRLGEVIMLVGALLVLIGGIGALRLPDVYSRMHAAAKVPTLGLILTVAGAELVVRSGVTAASIALAALLALLTGPVGAHLIGRSAHGRDGIAAAPMVIDELADYEATQVPPTDAE